MKASYIFKCVQRSKNITNRCWAWQWLKGSSESSVNSTASKFSFADWHPVCVAFTMKWQVTCWFTFLPLTETKDFVRNNSLIFQKVSFLFKFVWWKSHFDRWWAQFLGTSILARSYNTEANKDETGQTANVTNASNTEILHFSSAVHCNQDSSYFWFYITSLLPLPMNV